MPTYCYEKPNGEIIEKIMNEQKGKVEYLKSVLSMIENRSFHINNAINWRKFVAGLG